jgi:hypothetical protein
LVAGQSPRIPGVALLLAVTLPTGRALEDTRQPLGTDATGIGAFQATAGAAVEQSFGNLFVNLSAWLTQRAPRNVDGVSETLGLQVSGLGGLGYTLRNEWVVGGSLSYAGARDAVINGVREPGTGRSLAVLSILLTVPLGETWRLQAGAYDDLPFWGTNQPATAGLTLALFRAWV